MSQNPVGDDRQVVRPAGFVVRVLVCLLGLVAGAAWAADEAATGSDPLQITPAPGRALVYFLNPGTKTIDVFLDRNPIAILPEHAFFAAQVEPGRRVVWGTVMGRAFELEAGRTYVLIYWTSWTLQRSPPLAESVERLKLRYKPPAAGQAAELARRLKAGKYPWALQSLGELPLRFDRVSCGGQLLLHFRSPLSWGSFTVDEDRVTYRRNETVVEIPVTEIRELQVSQLQTEEWALSIFHGPPKSALKLDCVVAPEDLAAVRASLVIARERAARNAAARKTEVQPPAAEPSAVATPAPSLSPVERATRLAEALETFEKAPLQFDRTEEEIKKQREERSARLAELAPAARELDSYLESRTDDVQALLLAVRLGRLQEDHPGIYQGEGLMEYSRREIESRERRARLHSYLDRVLRRDPDNFDAYSLRARLYALNRLKIERGRLVSEPGDFAQAAAAARQAIKLKPGDQEVVTILARSLLSARKPLEETVTILRDVAGPSHPIPVLLADHQGFPLPDGAVPLLKGPRILADFLATAVNKESLDDLWLEFRVRLYVVPDSVRTIQSFYRRRWPKFDFVAISKKEQAPGSSPTYVQAFAWTPEGLQPTGGNTSLNLLDGDMTLFLTEIKNLPDDLSPSGATYDLKSPLRLLWVASRRPVATPPPADV